MGVYWVYVVHGLMMDLAVKTFCLLFYRFPSQKTTNRPQPLLKPPPTACLTASGAASEVPSLPMQPLPHPPSPTVRTTAGVVPVTFRGLGVALSQGGERGRGRYGRPPDDTAGSARLHMRRPSRRSTNALRHRHR